MPDFGLDILRTGYNKPTSIQFVTGEDGTVYLITSQQDGTLTVSTVTFTDTEDGRTYDETIVFETEIINTILNHNDDGSLSGTQGRQVTGFHARLDANGDLELYVTSSDPRIGGGGESNVDDKNLDTNSGVLSKVTINIPGTTENDGDWGATKIDLVRGIPRSEENHSVNGVDFTPDGNLLVMVGGFANAGAPSQNLVYTPEYFLSGTMLEIDVDAIEALPTLTDSEGQQYKYNLPTIGIQRGEEGDARPGAGFSSLDGMPWGGNDGYNQAYLETGGPVSIFATGFRNGYDVEVVELEPGDIGYSAEPGADNFRVYVWDNGANNGWGEAPANAQGQVFATNPSGGNLAIFDDGQWKDIVVQENGDVFVEVESVTGVFVNTGSGPEFLAAERPDNIPLDENNNPITPGAQDGLHFVERGGYYGSPNLFHANEDAILYLKPELEGGGEDGNAVPAPEFTDANGNIIMSLRDYLPEGVTDPLNGFEPSPLSGFYLKPTQGGAPFDPSLVLNNGSTNGIVVFEYIEGVHPQDMEIYDGDLFAVGFDEQILHVELSDDGRTALNRAAIESNNAFQSSPGANPLDITIGPDGSIWVAAHGAGNIFAFVSGGEPVQETDNDDNDLLLDAFDPFQLDPDNGLGVNSKVDPGEVFEFTMENEIGAPNGLDGFVLGLTGHQVNYTTEYFTNSSGVIAGGVLDGGIAGKLQIEFDAVGDGTAEGTANTVTYALQAGINYEDSSQRILLESELTNVWSGTTLEAGQSQGIYFGTGTQFDFASFSFAINDQGDEVVRVYIELNDQEAFVQEYDATGMTTVDDEDLVMRVIIDRDALTVQALWQYETAGGTVTGNSEAISLSQFGDNNLTEAIIGAGQGGFKAREAPENGERGDFVFSNLNTNFLVDLGLAVGVTGRVDMTNAEGGALFTPEFDNLLITASDENGDFAADARDEVAGDVEFGQTLVVDVAALLANDRSFEGGTLSITSVQADGNGTATLINGGTQVEYTPASPNEFGFTYTVADSASGAVATAQADVNITVPPIGGTVVHRLNTGAGTIAAVDGGPDWIGDTTAEGSAFITSTEPGSTFSNALSNEESEMDLTNLPNADDVPWQLFINERSDPPGNAAALEYTFDVDPGATYAVTVYYVENWPGIFTSAVPRVFDIAVNGEVPPEFQGIHPLADAAAALNVPTPSGAQTDEQAQPFLGTAISRTVVVTAETAELDLSFVTGTQQPKVNAIEIRELVPADSGPAVSISDGTAVEGDAVIFTLDLSDTAEEVVTIEYEIVPGTAQPGVDYDIGTATPDENGVVTGTTTIAASAADGSIVINTIGDDTFEGDLGFTVNITSVSGANAVIGTGSATGTIQDDETLPIGDVVYAINAGGSAPVDGALYGLTGVTFDTDTQAANHPTLDLTNATAGNGGTGNNTNGNAAGLSFVNPDGTPYTGDTSIFETERWTNDFGYNLPVENGTYVVDLYFAETFQGVNNANGVGSRKFDVAIEGQQVEDDLDLYDEGDGVAGNSAGQALVPIIKTYVVTVTDGVLDIDLNSLVSNGGADNAKISALVVREVTDGTPDPAVLSVVAPADVQETGDGGTTTSLVFDLAFDKTPEESVDITYSVSIGGVETQTDVPLTLGTADGQVTVEVDNDDVGNGPEEVVVTITSITTATDTAEISATDGSGTASVTEDDFSITPTDIDGDGIANTDDPFAYDGTNGDAKVLEAGGAFTQDFNTDTTNPFSAEGGFSGIIVNQEVDQAGSSETDPYGDRTTEAGVNISGGTLQVDSSNTDLFGSGVGNAGGNNQIKDNYQSAADVTGVDTFEVVARTQNPFAGDSAPAMTSFASFGITLGAGGVDDYIKFVLGGSGDGPRVQIAQENSLAGAKEENWVASVDGPSLLPPADNNPPIDITDAAEIEFKLVVDKVAGTVQGIATFFDAGGAELGVISTNVRSIDPAGSFAAALDGENPLTGGDGGIAYGISITDWSGAPQFTGSWDFLTLQSLDAVPEDALVSVSGRAPVVEQGDEGTTDVTFDVTADNGLSGDLEISYTVDTGDGPVAATETVSFIEGAGTITVSVDNDDIDDGDDLATVALTGVTTEGYSVDTENASADNTVTEDEFNTPYDEDVDGDLSDDQFAPTDIKTNLGDNLITAAQQGNPDPTPDEQDFFTITIEEGQVLDAIVLDGVTLGDDAAFIGFMAGDTFDADIPLLETNTILPSTEGLLGGYVYGSEDVGNDLLVNMNDAGLFLGFSLPLPAGTYTFWMNQNGPASEATLNFQISEVSTLEIGNAADIVEGGDDIAANDTLEFPITVSPAREGVVTINVTTDVKGVSTDLDVNVTLDASGQGILSVDVAQDDLDNGDDTITVTVNSVDGTAFELGTTTVATGLVTEDDTAAVIPGDIVSAVNAGGSTAIDGTAFGFTGTFETDTAASPNAVFTSFTPNQTNNSGANDAGVFVGELPNEVFFSERWASNLQYDLALEDGQYIVELYFAETYLGLPGGGSDGGVGDRIFDVAIEGELVIDNIDLFDEGDGIIGNGAGQAAVQIVKTFVVDVTDGNLDIDFTAEVDNAKISAIIVREVDDGIPDPAALSITAQGDVEETGDDATTTPVVFDLAFDTPPTESVDITYSVSVGGVETQTDVALTLGTSDGQITVDVPNDDLDNGAEAVVVTITSITTATDTAEISATNGSATANVTEDDVIDTSDLDDDGVVNALDPAYLDDTNGLSNLLEAGQTIGVEFNEAGPIDPLADGTGVSGVAVNPDETGTGDDVDPYLGLTTGTGVIENGLLTVATTNGDSFNNNNASANNYGFMLNTSQTDEFTVSSKIVMPEGGLPQANFAGFGIQIGDGTQESYIKVARAFGNGNKFDVRWDNDDAQADANPTGGDAQSLTMTEAQENAAAYEIMIDVDRSDPDNIIITPRIIALDESDAQIGAEIIGQAFTVTGDIAAAINGLNPSTGPNGGGLFVGAYSTDVDFSGDSTPSFDASWDYIRVTSNDPIPDTIAPTAVITPVDTITASDADIVVEVTFADETLLDDGSIDISDVTLTGEGVTEPLSATGFSVENGVATYTFAAPEGGWAEGDFTATVAAGSVLDDAGNGVGETTASISVDLPDPVLVSIGDAPTLVEDGDAGATMLVFPLALSVGVPDTLDLVIEYSINGGEVQTLNLDGTIFNEGGLATAMIPVPNDDVDNDTDAVSVTLVSVATEGYAIDGTANTATGSVTEDDQIVLPDITVAIASDQISVAEAEGATASFTVTLSEAVPEGETVEVTYTVGDAGDTATEGTDYVAQSGTLTFNPGDTIQQVTVALINDDVTEMAETLSVVITGATLGTEALTVETATASTEIELETDNVGGSGDEEIDVLDSDEMIDISSGGSDTIAGTPEQFDDVMIVGFDTDDTVELEGADPTTSIVDVREGSTVVGLDTTGDDQEDTTIVFEDLVDPTPETPLDENDFTVEFDAEGNAANLFFTPQQPEIQISLSLQGGQSTALVEEFEDTLTLTVELSEAADEDITISYQPSGTATDEDFELAPPLSITIPAGETTGSVFLSILDDALIETQETLTVTLTGASSGSIDVTNGAISFTIDSGDTEPPVMGDPITLEAEDFTNLDQSAYFAQGSSAASSNELIRLNSTDRTEVSTDLPEGVTPGVYQVAITYFDENDGQSLLEAAVDGQIFGTIVMSNDGSGNAAQSANLRTVVFSGVEIDDGALFSLFGTRDAGEFVRVDKVEFTRTGDVATNQPPTGTDIQDQAVDEGADVNIVFDYTDPEDDTLTISAELDGGLPLPDWLTVADTGITGTAPADAVGQTLDIVVTIDDGNGNVVTDAFALSVNDATGPIPNVSTGGMAGNQDDLTITVTFDDATGVDPITIDATDLLVEGPDNATYPASLVEFDPETGVATFTVPVPEGGFPPGEYGVSLIEEAVDDTLGNSSAATAPVLLLIEDTSAIVGANLDEDFDDDGTINSEDTDIDEDGVLNTDDAFAYDATDGDLALASVGSINIDLAGLAAGDSPFTAGFTGVMQPFTATTVELDYATNNGAQIVETANGNRLVVESSPTDTNEGQAAFTFGAKVSDDFTLSGTFDNPYFDGTEAPANFEQYGLIIGIDGGTFVKFVTGSPGADFELSGKTDNVNVVNPPKTSPLADKVSYAATKLDMDVEVTETTVVFTGTWTTLDAAGNELETGAMAPLTLTSGALFDAIQAGDTAVSFGMTHTQTAGPDDPFPVSLSSLTLTDGNIDLDGPTAAISVDDIADGDSDIVVTVTFEDQTGVEATSIDGDEIVLTSNDEGDVIPAAQLVDNLDGTYTYTFAAPEGGWNGTAFSVALAADSVADTLGNLSSAGAPVDFGRNDVDPVDDVFANITGVDTDGTYDNDATGSVILTIMDGVTNVRSSNFGANSFELTNTGDKQVAAVFIDVRDALYSDSVFDFDGSGGDTTAKVFQVNSETGNGTGAFFEGADSYFLAGTQPIPNTSGDGVTASGGFRGLLIKFDGTEGGFGNGELVGFSGDMDPNSIAGLAKGGTFGVDPGAIDGWDVGGVSGAELIGSKFTVLFDDGTTAEGYLHSDNSLAGSVGEAVQGRAVSEVSVIVNGFTSDDAGATYGGIEPTIIITGTPGDVVRVVMSQGFNPVTNDAGGVADIVANRLATQHPDFQANNALNFQTVDVVIGANGTATVPAGAFDYNAEPGNVDNPDLGVTPIAVTAAVIVDATDTSVTQSVALGPVADPVFLTNPTQTPVDPNPPAPEGYFEGIDTGGGYRFKIQIEDANIDNGGQNPGGDWVFVPDGESSLGDAQGAGSYYWEFLGDGNLAPNAPQENSILTFNIFVPEGEEGVYVLRLRAGRETADPSDARNDVWVRIDGDAEALQVEEINSVSNDGFIKIFGNPTGNWGFAQTIDSVSEEEPNFNAAFQLEPGFHTIQLAGRSPGFNIDFIELVRGATPGVNAADSQFVTTGDTAPVVNEQIDDIDLETGDGLNFAIPANAFFDADGDTLFIDIPVLPDGFSFINGVLSAGTDLPADIYPITVTATDDDLNVASQTFLVTVTEAVNDPPNAIDDNAATDINAAVTVDVLANDTDPEDDDLTLDSFTQGANGTVADLGNGNLQYTPNSDFVGSDSFTYTISDVEGLESTATVNVTVTDPDAFNIINANTGTEFLVGTDAADAFTFTPGTSVNGAIDTVFDWAPGDIIDLSALGLSESDYEIRTISGGTVVKLIEGFGAGEFHVKINLNGFSQEEVLDSVVYAGGTPPPPPPPPPPTAPEADNDSGSTSLNTATTINVLANDSDANGDDLSVSAFGQGSNGSVTDLGNGNLQYTPDTGFVGTDTFTYTVSDGDLTDQATVTVTVTDPSAFNVVSASVGTEFLRGTDGPDAYTFTPGTSVNGAIDTVFDWAPGDIIDLSALGLSESDFEVRTISGGTVVKLIEGFGAGEFHVKINLNGFSQEEVLDSVVYASGSSLSSLALSAMASSGPIVAGASSKTLFDPYEPLKEYDAYGEGGKGDGVVMTPVKEYDAGGDTVSGLVEALFEPAAATQPTILDDWFSGTVSQGTTGGSADIMPATTTVDFSDVTTNEDTIVNPSDWDFA